MAADAPARQGLLASLRTVVANPALRRINLALAASMIGDAAYATAVIVWAYRAGGAGAVGLFSVLRLGLMAVATPFAAGLSDRYSRRAVMIVCDLARAVVVLVAAGLVEWDGPRLAVYAMAALASVLGSPFRPAQMALVPSLVDDPFELTAANGVASTVESLAFFVGPALAGLLLAVADIATVFLFDVATFLVSAALVWGVRAKPRAERLRSDDAATDPPFLANVLAGFATVWHNPQLRLIGILSCAQTVVAGASVVFVAAIAIDLIDLGSSGVGVLNSVMGVGSVLGGLLAITLARRRKLGTDFGTGVLLWAAPILLIGIWPTAPATVIAMALLGVANPLVDINAATLMQRLVPDELMGRVFGALESSLIAGMALGALAMPLLIAGVGLRWGLAAIALPITVLAIVTRPALRRIDMSVREPESVGLLAALPLFQPLSRPVLEGLARQLVRREVAAGAVIFTEGDPGDSFYVIESGRFEARTAAGHVLRSMGAGTCFGEIALLRQVPRTASVIAVEPSVVQGLDRDAFLAAVTGHAEVASHAEALVAGRLEHSRLLSTGSYR